MDTIVKTPKEIRELLDEALQRSTQKSKWPGMTYEEGVRDTLDWLLGNGFAEGETPLSEE